MTFMNMNTNAKRTTHPTPTVRPDGAVVCGGKRYRTQDHTLRGEILRIMGRDDKAILSKTNCRAELITAHIPPRLRLPEAAPAKQLHYKRRLNNIEKAISRLRQDLTKMFEDLMPPGTTWLCFSEKIDGWLLYRLPGLGCDGEYHW